VVCFASHWFAGELKQLNGKKPKKCRAFALTGGDIRAEN